MRKQHVSTLHQQALLGVIQHQCEPGPPERQIANSTPGDDHFPTGPG